MMDQNISKNSFNQDEEMADEDVEEEELGVVECRLFDPDPPLYRVHTHTNQTKDMYIYKVNNGTSITGLYYGLIKDPYEDPRWKRNFKSNLNSKSNKEAWQMLTIIPKYLEFIRHSQPPVDLSSLFIKYGWDRYVYYGDGGENDLSYPLYRIQKLPIPDSNLSNLVKLLEDLGTKRQDWHQDSPVLDIIDPDLNPNYYFSNKKGEKLERNKYSWFPVDVLIRPDNSFKVLGEIHNLPKKGNEKLYEGIFEVFGKMLPGFRELGIFDDESEQVVQVVVKVQKYVIKPGISYSGKWHVEGKTENIVAGGVFYCKLQPKLEDDFLTFVQKKAPQECYASGLILVFEMEVPVDEYSAIVFSNELPHKFSQLNNRSEENAERLFINFFIVDPKQRLETNQLRLDAFRVLKMKSKLPNVLIDEILSYVYSYQSLHLAKQRRETVRESMKIDMSGWGYIHYGNCGEIQFVQDKTEVRPRDFDEIKQSSYYPLS